MAEVVRIEDRLARQQKRVSEPCEAKILLFTGVRYERLVTVMEVPPPKRSSARRKKS